jgi:hypothetical protein
VLFDAPLRVFYRREPDAARIEILSTPGNLGARVALLRVVREIATANRVAGDGVIVHGAALAWRGRGYVIAGPKNAGKTTLLLHLLWNTGATYMANDRAMIWHNAVPVRLRGMPTIVSVRASSLVHLPHLAEAFQHRPYHHRFSLDESDAVAHPAAESATGAANTSGVTPAQLARLLGVSRSGELPLAAVIFPQRAEAPSGARIEPLDAEETVVRLRAALFRAHARSLVGEFFTDCPPDGMSDPRDSLCAALARRIPGVACILGPNAYLTAGSAMRVLTALEQHTSHQWSSRNR